MQVILVACFTTGPVIYLLNLAPYGLNIGALLLAIGVIVYIRMPVSEVYVVGHSPVRYRSTVIGISYYSSIETGETLTPAIDILIDRFGFYSSFSLFGATLVVVALVCSVFLWHSWD